MKLFELVFIIVFLVTVGLVITVLVNGAMGRFAGAARYLKVLVVMLVVYFAVLVAVALLVPQTVVPLRTDLCFDDWCITVDDVTFARQLGKAEAPVKPKGVFYVVTLKISNRSAGREQRESGASVYVLDARGRRYEPSAAGQQAYEAQNGPTAPLSVTVQWHQSASTVRVFDLPADAEDVGLAIGHSGPGLVIIGDSDSLLHKKTVFKLPRPQLDTQRPQ